MKISLLSDIHANLPAFEKALPLIDAEKPDAVYCLGDLVGYNVWPNEVIAEIRRRGIVTIAGRQEFIKTAAEVRWSRELMGIHYPSDNEASRVIGWYLLNWNE